MSVKSGRNGFRGEYLARYIVSRFAFISESNVGEDYGIDFYCGLSKEVELETEKGKIECIQYDKPFLLQIKTQTKGEQNNKWRYIIYDTKASIKTIYSLEIPLFIGFLNLKEQILNIYSTSSMWFGHMLIGYEEIDVLTFKFKTNIGKGSTELSKPTLKDGKKHHIVDLGNPIVSLKLYNIEEKKIDIDNIQNILSECIEKEFENIVSKRLGLSYFRWMYEYQTNDPTTLKCGYKFVNKGDDNSYSKTTQEMINAMHPYLVALALSAKSECDDITYRKILELTRMVDSNIRYSDILKDFSEIYDDISYGDLTNYNPIPTSGYTYQTISPSIPTSFVGNVTPSPIYSLSKKRKSNKKKRK